MPDHNDIKDIKKQIQTRDVNISKFLNFIFLMSKTSVNQSYKKQGNTISTEYSLVI